jgi:ribosomal protein S18 acetylase RimI-like enzyme
VDDEVLSNPVWSALTGPQANFARRIGGAVGYAPDVSRFAALADPRDPQGWADLAVLTGPGSVVVLVGTAAPPPAAWTVLARIDGVCMSGADLEPAREPEARPLGPDDVEEMLDLVARTEPGPFAPRTIELGGYLGIHRDGRLIAMAGERFRPTGWAEISAVCTDPDHRGEGLARRLVRAVAARIRARGEVPFLHAAGSNTGAIRLYEWMGFAVHHGTSFTALQTPGVSTE